MKSHTLAIGLLAFSMSAVAADVETQRVQKTFETDNGNTVEIRRVGQTDHEGNARARTGYKVTDENGELVARGQNRARKTADGDVARAKRREFTDADGNTYQKRARMQKDAEGNVRAQRQRRKLDADGNVTARQRQGGRNFSDGSKVRRSQTQWQDKNGNRRSVKRAKRS